MANQNKSLVRGTLWTLTTYCFLQALRVGTSIVVARLLAPELFGIMLIVSTLKNGIELMTDMGIGQNLVYHQNAKEPNFYNTAWTLQAIRGIALWCVSLAVAMPVARFYRYPILSLIVPIAALTSVFVGVSSISRFLAQKRLQFKKLNAFDAVTTVINTAALIVSAYLSRTIWAFVLSGLFGSAAFTVVSYVMFPSLAHRIKLSRSVVNEILHFGKWIFLSSLLVFIASNFDRLYLAKVVPLALLGVYGIARSIADLLSTAVIYLGSTVLFPFIASHAHMSRSDLRKLLSPLRARLLLLAALGFSVAAAMADMAIKSFYDERYWAASWMLPALIIGAWFSVMANLNESTLLGLGKPFYGAFANAQKLLFLLIALVLGVRAYGLAGGVVVIALADLCRYIPILVGQMRERFGFVMQDIIGTLAMFSLLAVWEWIRSSVGLGTSFSSWPL